MSLHTITKVKLQYIPFDYYHSWPPAMSLFTIFQSIISLTCSTPVHCIHHHCIVDCWAPIGCQDEDHFTRSLRHRVAGLSKLNNVIIVVKATDGWNIQTKRGLWDLVIHWWHLFWHDTSSVGTKQEHHNKMKSFPTLILVWRDVSKKYHDSTKHDELQRHTSTHMSYFVNACNHTICEHEGWGGLKGKNGYTGKTKFTVTL